MSAPQAWKKRESGQNPERSGHCNKELRYIMSLGKGAVLTYVRLFLRRHTGC